MEISELQKQLGGVELACAAQLDAADVERYVALLDDAQAHQAASLAQASEQALKHVPALLRPAVRKLLF